MKLSKAALPGVAMALFLLPGMSAAENKPVGITPDMIVTMPEGDLRIPVDSKVPMDAYMRAMEAEDADVRGATERLRAAGMEHLVEDEKTCCYATQNKVWALEPEGLRWEWYRVTQDAETFSK